MNIEAAAASAPASPRLLAAAAARRAQRLVNVSTLDESIQPLPPCDRKITRSTAVDVCSLWEHTARACREKGMQIQQCQIMFM